MYMQLIDYNVRLSTSFDLISFIYNFYIYFVYSTLTTLCFIKIKYTKINVKCFYIYFVYLTFTILYFCAFNRRLFINVQNMEIVKVSLFFFQRKKRQKFIMKNK